MILYTTKIQQNLTDAKKNEKNFAKPTCRHPFARLATVSRAPAGFHPHPPSLSLVFRFSYSSAYARVFLSFFSLIGVFLLLSFFFSLFIASFCLLIGDNPTKKGIFESNRPKKGNRRQFLLPKLPFGDLDYKKTLCFLYNICNYYRMLGKMENVNFSLTK